MLGMTRSVRVPQRIPYTAERHAVQYRVLAVDGAASYMLDDARCNNIAEASKLSRSHTQSFFATNKSQLD